MHYCRFICLSIKIKVALFTVVMATSCIPLQAQTEKFIQSVTGIIKKGDSCVVTDDKFNDTEKWATIEKHYSVDNLVTFELRYDTAANYLNRPFSCKLLVDIEYEKADRTKQQLKNISLEVDYDTARGSTHRGISYYKFKDAHYVKITVSKITSAEWGNKVPPAFRLKNEIFIERAYSLQIKDPVKTVIVRAGIENVLSAKNMRATGSNHLNREDIPGQQYTISWDGSDPAFPQYDFEWTFYSDNSLVGSKINNGSFTFSPAELSDVFKNNSSRVTVGLPSYQLNIIYNKGWVFHRVRGVRYDDITGERTEGAWSYAGNYSYHGNSYGLLEAEGHEAYLNWQYNISLAEEGKRKETVRYFDGSLRNRQSVTLGNDNTGSRTVVQENVFDALGRAAVDILPAPTEETALHYFHDFNKSAVSGLPYHYTDIETQNDCAGEPFAMSTVSGASQYYSSFNPKKDDNSTAFYFTKYIPDANGYPFAITSFTADNTGRVRTQGGVGSIFQPGKSVVADDHTTRYFYGKPQQDELDRLFGNEAGNASHYLKNMVIDANGQTSVSYINASGKTIATALAGKRPDNLQPLPSYQLKSMPFITALTDRDNIVRDAAGLSLTYSGTFLAAATGAFTLKYAFTPLSLQVLYGVENNKICADCYYDLLINVTDNCGNPVQSVKQEAVFTEKTTCNPAPTRQLGELPVTIPQAGEYNITYQLTLSRKAIDYYVDQYLVQNLSLKKEIDFQRSYIHRIDLSGCFNNCETCLADLGTEQNFVARMTGMLQANSITPNNDDIVWMKGQYKQLLDECNLLQQGCGKTELPCEAQTLQLKEDVMPGGQYMLYDAATDKFTERDINVYLKNINALTTNVTINGITKPINQFSEADIITNWQDAWADILLPYHPENKNNCFIADCGKNAESELFDTRFLNTQEAATASSLLYWFGDDYRSVVNNDPYFKAGAEGASKKPAFLAALTNYKGLGLDIMSFVRWNIYCQDKPAGGNYPTQVTACPRTVACNREEDEWSLFKVLYYSTKQEIKNKNAACNSNDLFVDPASILAPVTDQSAVAPGACAAASLFEMVNNNGTVTIQYTGTEKTTQDVTVQYFAVDGNSQVVAGAGGNIVFPGGTTAGTAKTATSVSNLVYSINFARCDPVHPYYTKVRRNYNGVNMSSAAGQLQNKPADQLNAAAAAATLTSCNESCEQNADGWMQQLEGCNLAINSNEYTQIHDGLTAVCKSSCQFNVQDHPFGASGTSVATANGDKNFKDVLLRVLGQQRFSTVCNDLLLDYPAPIDANPLYANQVVRTLSSCAYDKLQAWKAAYRLSAGYTSFADYIKKTIDPVFSLTDADITSLVNAYENSCVTPRPLLLPASLSCTAAQPKTCLTCTDLQDEKLNFASAYGYVPAADPGYYGLLAKYINRKYTFNLSSVDIYNALQQCTPGAAATVTDTISCTNFAAACHHFQQLQPDYFTNLNGGLTADSLYKIHLTLWLNTELNRRLDFNYYENLATACNLGFDYPGNGVFPACDTAGIHADCAPQFITCCEPFAEMERFKKVFTDSVNARLLALYFSLQHTQWCTPVNLPDIGYALPYDSIVYYFNHFKLANGYTITVRPDSSASYSVDNTGTCNATALNFKNDAGRTDSLMYAVCNKPLEPLLAVDDNSCTNQQVNVALGNAHSDYLEYQEKMKRDYRDAYYTKCLSITPGLTLEAVYDQPLEYHYTLYYYDQSGNLVKTIPPAGVQPVDEETGGSARMQRTKNFRLADKDYCYEYGDAPAMNANATIMVTDNPLIQQTSLPFTIEAFVNFNNLAGHQTILSKQSANTTDNKTDGYRIYLNNGRLAVDISAHGNEQWIQTLNKIVPYAWPAPYTAQPPVTIRTRVQVAVPRILYRSLTAEVTSDISGLISSGQWIYLAVQNTGNWNNPINIYINGNLVSSQLVANRYDYTPAGSPALTPEEAAAGTTEFSFAYSAATTALSVSNNNPANLVIGAAGDGLNGSIKQVRLYNRAVPVTEIRNNAFNTCLVPQSEGKLVLWLPLNKEETAGSSTDRINRLTTINSGAVFSNAYQPVYPVHTLPTHYYYNSLNAVTEQVSPDGGETHFFYDLMGRLVVSQNAEQKISTRGEANNRYSYTKYDVLGRITEIGEKTGAAVMTTAIAKTDPTNATSPVNNWLASGTDIQVTQTIYDHPNTAVVTNIAITGNQDIYNTSRKRVVATIYRNTISAATDYNSATHYQYDINGNVKRLWQEYKKSVTGVAVNMLKDLQYGYDLVSGKINHVIYQQGRGDQFIYKYEYDPDNRLLRAYSGRDMNTLQLDAGYRYYLHGPMARMELGDALTNRLVQGCDYVYTLQGWLKGINGWQLPPAAADRGSADAGGDGSALAAAGMHAQVGADALAYTLGYYKGDYIPIGGSSSATFGIQYQPPSINGSDVSGKELFNGNISHATYGIAGIDNAHIRGYTYGYDQLNRLREMQAHNLSSITAVTGWNNGSVMEDHKESFTYDANGNISTLFRNGITGGGSPLAMDDQVYRYYYYTLNNNRKTYVPGQPLPADAWALTNQLAQIKDAVPAGNYPAAAYPDEKDIDDQPLNNYTYDGIGNLVKDNAERITKIGWTVYSRIRSIDKAGGTSIVYDYDAAGNRIQKQTITGGNKTITYYIRDVQGKTIAVYGWHGRFNATPVAATPGNGVTGQTWEEQHLYGSNRLGMWKPGITVPATLNTTTDAVRVGSKFFELTNHLGNVLAVISDKKVAVPAAGNPAITDHYTAELISAGDYTPFGMQMVGRQYSIPSTAYRYGFNGKENDNEVKGEGRQQDYGMRVYDPVVGRFLSVDPVTARYPMLTPYQFGSDSPVSGVDQDGLEYSPAGKVGIFAIDHTAVQLYPNNPVVIQQQKADAPMVHLSYMVARVNSQPAYLSPQRQPGNELEKQRHEIDKEAWYDRDGYNADGSPRPLTRLAKDKTWSAFATNLALPFFDIVSNADGEGEVLTLIEAASKNATRENITALVDVLFSSTKTIKELDTKAVVGYRGSLATGIKYKTGGPFNPASFDVDAFIVSDKLAKQFNSYVSFRNGRKIAGLKEFSNNLESIFTQIPGYRIEKLKPFTFRIFTIKEFKSIVKSTGYKTF